MIPQIAVAGGTSMPFRLHRKAAPRTEGPSRLDEHQRRARHCLEQVGGDREPHPVSGGVAGRSELDFDVRLILCRGELDRADAKEDLVGRIEVSGGAFFWHGKGGIEQLQGLCCQRGDLKLLEHEPNDLAGGDLEIEHPRTRLAYGTGDELLGATQIPGHERPPLTIGTLGAPEPSGSSTTDTLVGFDSRR